MTGIILAGGKNRRLGRDKAFLEIGNQTVLDRIIRLLSRIFEETLIVTDSPKLYRHLTARVVEDVIPNRGALGGVYSGLFHSHTMHNFLVASDMPFLNRDLIVYMKERAEGYDVVIPKTALGYEPLHGFYSKNCLTVIKAELERGNLRIADFFDQVAVKFIEEGEVRRFDPQMLSFFNINTPQDLEKARKLHNQRGQ